MTKTTPELWTPRGVDETLQIYKDWAANYEADVAEMGYATPGRIALALRQAGASPSKPVLDYGCGTGLSGLALKAVGYDIVDGTDISPEMLEKAQSKEAYRQVWQGSPGDLGHIERGDYATIVACGVVSLGAAPPETLVMLTDALGPAGMLAFSYNGATLADQSYMDQLDEIMATDQFDMVFEENGQHLPAKDMSSTVYVLQRK